MRPLRRLAARYPARSAISAIPGEEPAETLAETASRPPANPLLAAEGGPASSRLADPLLAEDPSNHAGFSPQVAGIADLAGGGAPANDDGDTLESVGIVLDEAGDPALPCATCGGRGFHRPPGDRWRCSACESPMLPSDAAALAGWWFCALPPDPDTPAQDAPPGAVGGAQDADPAPGQSEAPSAAEASPGASPSAWDDLFQDAPPGCQGDAQKRDFVSAGSGVPPTADGSPDAPPAAWSDDRGWIARWRTAGPTLPDRLPVARAWITAAPSLPLPQCLASIEIRRIAAQHGIAVEIAHRVEEFAP
jgi:hypothetical protein